MVHIEDIVDNQLLDVVTEKITGKKIIIDLIRQLIETKSNTTHTCLFYHSEFVL